MVFDQKERRNKPVSDTNTTINRTEKDPDTEVFVKLWHGWQHFLKHDLLSLLILLISIGVLLYAKTEYVRMQEKCITYCDERMITAGCRMNPMFNLSLTSQNSLQSLQSNNS